MFLRVEATRGGIAESGHRVSVAVSDQAGRVLAWAGDPGLVTFWRSAAKPFQAYPLVNDGAADRFGFTDESLALACASHSSEPRHRELARVMLERIGARESDLACGPHPPIVGIEADATVAGTPTPYWSNCSGKHAGMLALARHHGWPTAGYEQADHPVQRRLLAEVARWSGVPADTIRLGVDGCGVACFALPLAAMARAYAQLAVATDPALHRIASAMMLHPFLVAGTGRLCTDLMTAFPGQVIAKVGAEGIYCAALPNPGLGLALKVEDGAGRASGVALLEILRLLADRLGVDPAFATLPPRVERHSAPSIVNTRGAVVGAMEFHGTLRFAD